MSIFDTIYKYNLWFNGSGSGSIPWNNKNYINYLQNVLNTKNIQNIVEVGCGDYRLWKDIKYTGNYTGLDIVHSVIENNNKIYKTKNVKFLNLDISKEEMKYNNLDLVIIKDLFIHLPNEIIIKIISNIFKMQPQYILITEDTHYLNLNYNIIPGMYRPLYVDKYLNNMYNLEDALNYYETTYIIYLIIIGILTLFYKLFLLLIIFWIPRKRIALFHINSI
jgi:hypothetical protein